MMEHKADTEVTHDSSVQNYEMKLRAGISLKELNQTAQQAFGNAATDGSVLVHLDNQKRICLLCPVERIEKSVITLRCVLSEPEALAIASREVVAYLNNDVLDSFRVYVPEVLVEKLRSVKGMHCWGRVRTVTFFEGTGRFEDNKHKILRALEG